MKTILLIENVTDILENLTEAFEMEGYKVITAASGARGVELAREFIPDIIVSEILIGKMDGYEVLQALSNNAETFMIPFIFSTTKSLKRDKALAYRLGADDYIVKPYELEELFVAAEKWIRLGSKRVFKNVADYPPFMNATIEFNQQLIVFQNPLKYFALKLTSNNEDAEDLLQETFLKALKYKNKFQEATNLKAWLHTIMKNTFINNYRRNVRKRTIMDNTDDDYFVNSTKKISSITPDSEYNHKDILKTVNMLNDKCKIPFQMHFDGYKYKEIAGELNMPIGTVKSRISLARKKLTDALKDFA